MNKIDYRQQFLNKDRETKQKDTHPWKTKFSRHKEEKKK